MSPRDDLPPGADPATQRAFIYVGDPMCSWCWGFAPVLRALTKRLPLPLELVVGGLRPGPRAQPVDDEVAAFLAQCWTQVHAASGQPFDHTLLERRGWRYDTLLPCAAVVAMRGQAPQHTLAFNERLHRAFYVEGQDITRPDPYIGLVADFVADPTAFVAHLSTAEAEAAAQADFSWARRLGIGGFPTLLFRDGGELSMITQGFRPAAELVPALEAWAVDQLGLVPNGEMCGTDGVC